MNTIARLLLIAALAVPLAACNKEAETTKQAEKAPLSAPTNEDSAAWKAYISDVVGRNMDGVTNSPYVYLLPAEGVEDFEGMYERQLDKATSDILSGVLPGNMLAYAAASQSSTKIADLVVAAYASAKPDKLKGVKVLFVGKAEDNERVKAAVAVSGARYVFVEAK